MEPIRPGREEGADVSTGELHIDGTKLKCLPNMTPDQLFPYTDINRTEVLDYGDECFLLENVLSKDECFHFIKEGEQLGFGEIGSVRRDYRSSDRISFQSSDLASLLWERIKPFLKDIEIDGDPHDKHIEGVPFLLRGVWKPKELNNVFRLCRYFPGGHFAPHNDGFFVRSAQERSLQTFMLYLNCEFTGGSTNFIDPSQQLYKDSDGRYCAEEKNILYRIQPKSGQAIIFNHCRLHEGQKLGEGVKYILRTDIMFEKSTKTSLSSNEDEAILLLQEADRLEARGECMSAMELYRKAFKLCPDLEVNHGVS